MEENKKDIPSQGSRSSMPELSLDDIMDDTPMDCGPMAPMVLGEPLDKEPMIPEDAMIPDAPMDAEPSPFFGLPEPLPPEQPIPQEASLIPGFFQDPEEPCAEEIPLYEEVPLLPEIIEDPVLILPEEPELLPDDPESSSGLWNHAQEETELDLDALLQSTSPIPTWYLSGEISDMEAEETQWDPSAVAASEEPAPPAPAEAPAGDEAPPMFSRPRPLRKGRPKRKKGYGFFGIPHLLATVVWLAIIVMIGTTLGRMIWVCAADVLAFGRESKRVSITITSNDTIDDITTKLKDAGLIRYPAVFKLYASIAVDEGDIIPGTFEMDTIYDYHALVVQMGPRSSNRAVVEDVLIPEGLNCRQIFELLEQHNICTVKELEEYAANGEFSDFWFLEGVERGDKYCLEGFLFPDTYDFYANSTPREALGKMLLGFESRFTQDIYDQLPALNERLSAMMRGKGCSEEWIASHQLTLRDLLTVASLIEEETASVKESPIIASVIFNRLTEDQMYERYLNIDAAIIYATGDPNNIDTSFDSPYNTYLYPGLTPGPISNPGLDSINAALNFADTGYYYYVLNPETGLHQFSTTLAEHEQWVEAFRGTGE